jgi:hypothetical protein
MGQHVCVWHPCTPSPIPPSPIPNPPMQSLLHLDLSGCCELSAAGLAPLAPLTHLASLKLQHCVGLRWAWGAALCWAVLGCAGCAGLRGRGRGGATGRAFVCIPALEIAFKFK